MHSRIVRALTILIWSSAALLALIGYLNYNYYGVLSASPHVLFYAIQDNVAAFAFVTFASMVIIVYQYRIYKATLASRANCSITYVKLEEIAQDWLDKEEIRANLMLEVKGRDDDEFKQNEKIAIFLKGLPPEHFDFYQKYIIPHLGLFSKEELDIVSYLYDLLLKKAKNLPSVASLYKKDSEVTSYNKMTSLNLTKYEIFTRVKLFDHTMHVVEAAYEKSTKAENINFYWNLLVIACLGHDIGKIEAIEEARLENGLYQNNTHEDISSTLITLMFPEYKELKEVTTAIKSHHIPLVDEASVASVLTKLLKEADQAARERELKEFYSGVENKQNQDDKNEDTKNNQDEKKQDKKLEERLPQAPIRRERLRPKPEVTKTISKQEAEEVAVKSIIEPTQVKTEVEIEPSNPLAPKPSLKLEDDEYARLYRRLALGVNATTITKTDRASLISVSQGDKLYFSKSAFYSIVKEEKIENEAALLEKLKAKEVLLIESTYCTLSGFSNMAYRGERGYLVFSLEKLANIEEAALLKRNNPHLRNVKVNEKGELF
ncbi:MAG: HD domain-containing protein [Sulfurimonadaceae bacterium]|nr:HD domain-containing protein [Sulfurimonadaceae bacterium]